MTPSAARYMALWARGHSCGHALRGVGDRLLGVAYVLLQWGMLFDPDHGTPTAPQVRVISLFDRAQHLFVLTNPRQSAARKRRPGGRAAALAQASAQRRGRR